MLSDEGVGMAALYWCGQFTWGDFRLRTRPRCTAKYSTLVVVLASFDLGSKFPFFLHILLRDVCVLELANGPADSVCARNAHCAKKHFCKFEKMHTVCRYADIPCFPILISI